MAGRAELNRGKLKELMLLFVERSRDDELMSRIKLNKQLYRADFEAFRLLGHSMTGATYIAGEFGPMVDDLPIYEEELGKAGRLRWESRGEQKVPLPTDGDPADVSQFSEDELAIIDEALLTLRDFGGKAASDWSHEESAGWRVREEGDTISYESGLIDLEPIDDQRLLLLRQYVDTLTP